MAVSRRIYRMVNRPVHIVSEILRHMARSIYGSPGFDLLSEDLQSLQEKTAGAKSGRLESSAHATRRILYFNALSPSKL